MSARDATSDPELRSWIAPDAAGDFPIQNLPYGIFVRGEEPRPGVAIGDHILDLRVVAAAGLLAQVDDDARALFAQPSFNALMARGRAVWRALRERISGLLSSGSRELAEAGIAESALVPRAGTRLLMPFAVGDYVDFYSSLEHASNAGKIFRPGGEPLLPNWRHLPVGYHGRSGTVVVSGTPVVRPSGQTKTPEAAAPAFGPSRMLDFELELGFVTGDGPALGVPIPVQRAREHIFGMVLVNDWSARDVQAWEAQPLGPFSSKSFATSISPWIVTLDALEPYRVAAPRQEPEPLAHLREPGAGTFDIELEVELASAAMREAGTAPLRIAHGNYRGMYWSMAQQLAHLTANGATVRAGDLCASGTISGSEPGTYGSLLEITWRGSKPIALPDGSSRAFLEDGDRVTLRAACPAGPGRARIGFGEVSGTIAPARGA
jgi:fumarylacetoacetase